MTKCKCGHSLAFHFDNGCMCKVNPGEDNEYCECTLSKLGATTEALTITEARAEKAEQERDDLRRQLAEAQARSRAICNDFMNQLPTLWGDHVSGGKITVTLDAELVERIEDKS